MQLKKEYPVYTFSSFSESDATKAFSLDFQVNPKGFIDQWIEYAKTIEITEYEQRRLKELYAKLSFFVRFWNEQELREKLIAPLSELVNFDMADIKVASFSEREMKIVHEESIFKGKVEWMVAKGISKPEQPFFFIHEYKKEQAESKGDPVGQLLATLSVAKLLNEQTPKPNIFNRNPTNFSHIPLYGCYVIGRLWFFVRLKGQQYCVSKSFDSTEEQNLHFIFKMLKAQKQMIRELMK